MKSNNIKDVTFTIFLQWIQIWFGLEKVELITIYNW
jgi:hypothetical protein